MADFASADALIEHLEATSRDPQAYNRYLWTHSSSAAEIARRWPELHEYDVPSGGGGREANRSVLPRECQLAVTALLRGGVPGPRLTPDYSCLPPRTLCHFLPRGECTPAAPHERPHAVVQSRRSYGIRPRHGFFGWFALRCVHYQCDAGQSFSTKSVITVETPPTSKDRLTKVPSTASFRRLPLISMLPLTVLLLMLRRCCWRWRSCGSQIPEAETDLRYSQPLLADGGR